MTNLENALIWLYVKTWGKFGDHVIEEKDLWNFSAGDLETVIMGLTFPGGKKKRMKLENNERVKALTDLIMDKFDQDGTAFYEWVVTLHNEVIDTLPETVQDQQQEPRAVKILEWDPGKFSRLLNQYLLMEFKMQ